MSDRTSPEVEQFTPEAQGQGVETVYDSISNDGTGEAQGAPQQPEAQANEPHRPVMAHRNPVDDELDRELQELEAWHQRAMKLDKVTRLRETKARYLAGDTHALQVAQVATSTPSTIPAVPTSGLPRPEPPHVFAKRNRVDYNRWKRDCERYFDRLPANFPQEAHKVDFGAQYLSETMKSLWAAHCADKWLLLPLWTPTWESMKAVMLGSLGTPSERRQRAYESLTRARMLPHSTPTELLDYMRPYWEELGSTHGPELQVMGFVHALPEDIQKQLFMYPEDRRETLTQVEEIANLIHRQKGRPKAKQESSPAKSQGKFKKEPKSDGGSNETPKKSKRGESDP